MAAVQQEHLNQRLIGKMDQYQPMFSINVRMSDALIDALNTAAADANRTTRGLIRHVLWTSLAAQGYLSADD